MKTYTQEELAGVVEAHKKWRSGEPGGVRANLAGANLAGANLVRANLDGAYLAGANLDGANLDGAYLDGAYLAGANLDGAYLAGAYLAGANLAGANLARAYLEGAYLARANLARANLDGAYLARANLAGGLVVSGLRVMTGLYRYQMWAVCTQEGVPWVRMGCLFYSLERWEEIGIRNSNPNEYPDDGSAKCEERVRAFEFARDMAARMAAEFAAKAAQESTP